MINLQAFTIVEAHWGKLWGGRTIQFHRSYGSGLDVLYSLQGQKYHLDGEKYHQKNDYVKYHCFLPSLRVR